MTSLSSLEPTEVFDTFWHFATERQAVFFRRLQRHAPPWTEDPIVARFRFTNAYRAADRVSQFLIRKVIYGYDDVDPEEVFFRTILFKLFNKIETWVLLESALGRVCYESFSVDRYSGILESALKRGERIYSAAYIMPPARQFAAPRKHTGHLRLLGQMMREELPQRLADAESLCGAFELLRQYPMMGNFLAYQYVIDLNYGPLLCFPEMEFVVPGPGAHSGIRKCFRSLGGLSEAEIICLVTDRQEEEFARRGLQFQRLWGRPLQLVDCQNLFCEVDKYARIAHPEAGGPGARARIKQVYRPRHDPIDYWFPPKWGLNERVAEASIQ